MKKRILSMLLALCLLAGILPPQAMAAGETGPSGAFGDVKPTDWYYEGVEYVRQHNLMNGTDEGTFSPGQQMSRGMTATVLHRLAGCPAPAAPADFSDVPAGQWYSQAIGWAAEQQLVSGYGDGLFGLNDPVTRQQLTAILYRYAQKSGADLSKTGELSAFADRDQIAGYALASMQWAVGSGLLTGTSATTLSPNGTATRGQIATILARFAKNQTKEGQFTVSFNLNDETDSVYQTQKVEAGKPAAKPADPTRSGYAFAGWHTKKEGGTPYDFAAPVTSDLILYALWNKVASGAIGGGGGFGGGGSGSGGSGSGGSESSSLYSITGVTMAQGKPQITVNTDKACTLQVRLLDDEGKITLDTATAQVPAQLELENIQVPLAVTPPEYFRLEAALLDENGKELCDKFLCVKYTSAYVAFDEATVDDFQGQIVLNFDEQPDENFGVLPKGAIQAQAAPAGRAAGGQIMLDNTDHRLDETKAGDIIAVYNAQGQVEDLVKVRAITLSENQARIDPDPDATLEDFYDLLKVDITIDADESMVDMSEADEGVTLVPSEEEQQGRATITNTVKIGIDREIGEFINLKLEGSYSSSITLEIEWEPHLFKDSYFYFNQESVSDWEYTGEISAKIDSNEAKTKEEKAELNLGKLKLPTGIPGVQSELVLSLPISLALEGNVTVSQTIHDERTFSYSSESGTHSGSKQEITDSLDFAAKVTVEIAFKVSLSCQLWNEIIKASCSFSLGLEITGELSKNLAQKPEVEEIHTCDVCIDGNAEEKVSVDMSLTAKPVKTKLTLASYAISITLASQDFYFSHRNSLDSPLGGHPKFGWGKCPNKKYRTEFAVQDSAEQAVSDAQLTVTKGGQQIPDAAPGKAVYLYNGDYTVAAQAGDQQGSKDFKVNGKAQTVTVQLGKGADEPDNPDVPDQPIIPKISDRIIAAGYSHSGIIDENGSLWVWGRNERGQLGNGTIDTALSPIKILDDVRSISIGAYHMAAIRTDGSLWIWGCNHDGELGNGIIGNDEGYIWDSWGGDYYPIQTIPVKIMDDVSFVSCGDEFTAVIKTDRSLWMWGLNEFGQIGNGTTELVAKPVKIMDDVVAVSAGNNHTAALKSDGTLWTWGNNDYNMLLDNYSLSPVQILDDVIAIEEGAYNTAAIRTDGSLWMRGRITYDGLYMSTSDVMIPVLQEVNSVSLGYSHYGVIKSDGSLWLWGSGDHGRLGLTNGVQSDPREMTQSTMDDVLFVGIGQVQTIAIKSDGSVWTWGGENTGGQLGNGTTDSAWLPTKIPGLTAKIPSNTENSIPKSDISPIFAKNLP